MVPSLLDNGSPALTLNVTAGSIEMIRRFDSAEGFTEQQVVLAFAADGSLSSVGYSLKGAFRVSCTGLKPQRP